MSSTAVDPYAPIAPQRRMRFLYALNPLAKLAAAALPMIALVFVRDLATPVAFLVLSYLVLLIGARLTPRLLAVLLVVMPVAIAALALVMAAWVDVALVDDTAPLVQVGPWTLYRGAFDIGLATALRLGAIIALALAAGLTTTGPDLVRAAVQQLRVPYRIGYTALAAFRFVPRFGYELDVIRQAHRVRGAHGGRGPFSALARWAGYIVPLLAGAIRHAERVALAMDARAFGAYPDRTERHLVPFRVRDVVFIVLFWAISAAVFWWFAPGR